MAVTNTSTTSTSTISTSDTISSNHPERLGNDDDMKSCRTAARRRADAVNDRSYRPTRQRSPKRTVRGAEGSGVEPDEVETDDDDAEDDDHTKRLSRYPVGTTDGDERCPNGPTKPPDEKEDE
ncbi:hypothetical protein BDN67DRAFT_975509, partial [Paxillus ammoniavirescens]